MSEKRARRTDQIRSARVIRLVLLSLLTGTLSCGGGSGDDPDGPTGPNAPKTNFTEDTSVAGVVTLTELTVAAGVTITATDNLVCDIEGDIVINGDLVGDCVEITVFGQGSFTLNGTIRNACSVPRAAGAAPALLIANKGNMSLAGATIRSSGRIDLMNSNLQVPQFDGNPADVPSPSGEPPAVLSIVNSTIEVGPERARDGQAGIDGETGDLVLIIANGAVVFGGTTFIKSQDGGNGADAVHEGAPAHAEGSHGGFGGPLEILASGTIDFGSGSVTIQSGRGGDGGGATAIGTPGSGVAAPSAQADGGRGERGGELRIFGVAGVMGGANAHVRMGGSGAGGWAEATGPDGDPEQCTNGQAQSGGGATAAGGEESSSREGPVIFGASIIFDRDPVEGGDGGDGGDARSDGGRGADGSADCRLRGGEGGGSSAWGGDGADSRTLNLEGDLAGEGGLPGNVVLEGGTGGNGFNACSPPDIGGEGGIGGTAGGRVALGGAGRSGSGGPGTFTLNGVGNGGNGGDGGGEGGPGAGGPAGEDMLERQGCVGSATNPSFLPGPAGGRCS